MTPEERAKALRQKLGAFARGIGDDVTYSQIIDEALHQCRIDALEEAASVADKAEKANGESEESALKSYNTEGADVLSWCRQEASSIAGGIRALKDTGTPNGETT